MKFNKSINSFLKEKDEQPSRDDRINAMDKLGNGPNYELIIIDRYYIGDSKVVVVTGMFIDEFEVMLQEQIGRRTASIGMHHEGIDDEEKSYIWSQTKKELNDESHRFMSTYEFDEDEDEDDDDDVLNRIYD